MTHPIEQENQMHTWHLKVVSTTVDRGEVGIDTTPEPGAADTGLALPIVGRLYRKN